MAFSSDTTRVHLAGRYWLVRHLCVVAVVLAGDVLAEGRSTASSAQISSAAQHAEQLFEFAITAQPLVDALNHFALISGRSALFRNSLVEGRISSPVHGRYTASEALRLLVADARLEVEEVSADAVTALLLRPSRSGSPASPVAPRVQEHYETLVSSRIWAVLCEGPVMLPDHYRAILKVWLDRAGKVTDVAVFGSSDDLDRDAQVLERVRQLNLGAAPPGGMQQPMAMVIFPAWQAGHGCGEGEGLR